MDTYKFMCSSINFSRNIDGKSVIFMLTVTSEGKVQIYPVDGKLDLEYSVVDGELQISSKENTQ